MIQHPHHEKEARDASRELAIASAIMLGLLGLVIVTTAIL